MAETVHKLHPEKTRFYANPARTYFYSPSRNQSVYPSYSRTGYFSQTSRRNFGRGLSRLSTTKSGFTNTFSGENELECQNILCKRGFLKRIFHTRFNNLFNTEINNSNNCKKYGIILLILFFINLCITLVVFIANDPVICKKELTDYKNDASYIVTIDPQDCNISSKQSSGFKINHEKIYVYYSILNYPFHFSSVFKLHSKLQFQGKISRVPSDLALCGSYLKLHINGLHRIINPCGAHVVNVYNDQFKFLRTRSGSEDSSPKDEAKSEDEDRDSHSQSKPLTGPLEGYEELELDDRKETLIKRQEYVVSRNVSNEDKLTFNDYYWIADTIEYSKDLKVGLSKDFFLLNGWNKGNTIFRQLNSENSGYGVRNGHFVQWMSPPPFPDFAKLYGVLKGPVTLPLTFQFINNYDVTAFYGKKFIILKASSYNLGELISLRIIFGLFTVLSLSFSLLLLLYKPKDQNSLFNLL